MDTGMSANDRRIRARLGTVVGTVAACSLLLAGCGGAPSAPALRLEMPVIDLGVLDPGTREVSIPIANVGGSPLKIAEVTSSCSCTVAEGPCELPAGGRGSVQATVKVSPGPGSARLAVACDQAEKTQVVHLTWFGKSPPQLVPSTLQLVRRRGEEARGKVEVS
jgi:hypothetical protein